MIFNDAVVHFMIALPILELKAAVLLVFAFFIH